MTTEISMDTPKIVYRGPADPVALAIHDEHMRNLEFFFAHEQDLFDQHPGKLAADPQRRRSRRLSRPVGTPRPAPHARPRAAQRRHHPDPQDRRVDSVTRRVPGFYDWSGMRTAPTRDTQIWQRRMRVGAT